MFGKKKQKRPIIQKTKKVVQGKKKPVYPDITRRGLLHELEVHQIELELQNEELKKSQKKLKEEEERYFDLYNLAPLVYLTINEQGIILEANMTASKIFGVPRHELIQQSLTNFICKEDQDIYYLFQKKFLKSQVQESCELRMVNHAKNIFYAHLSVVTVKNSANQITSRLIVSDISKLKSREMELEMRTQVMIRQSRQAALGEMIAMIAHQWRQPITSIGMNANNILVDIELNHCDKKELAQYAKNINEQIEHLSKTIDDFRNFFKSDNTPSTFVLKDILTQTFSILKGTLINNGIKLETDIQSEDKMVSYQRELMQVFINLINNAKDALLSNKTKNALITCKAIEEKKNIIISVCDNGGGIPTEILPKIFDAYFTTKEEKEGTGLGLYMSKLIVEKHLKGTLSAMNRGAGTCFIITLPKSIKI